MVISFFAGLFFVLRKLTARFIVAIPIVTIAGLIIAKIIFPDVSRSTSGALIHVIFWPLIYYGIWHYSKQSATNNGSQGRLIERVYSIWFMWVTALVVISLCLDVLYLLRLFMWNP